MLSAEQIRHFEEKGYVKLPGAIPPDMVAAAVRTINISIGQNGIDPARLTEFRAQSYCNDVQAHPTLVSTFNDTFAREAATELIGDYNPITKAQIALRFPTEGPREVGRPHIDGLHTPTNGVPEGEIQSFTALAGMFLSDVTEDFAGNFTVWPGTHILNQNYFREKGPQSLLEGMPQVELPEPEQIKVKAGDVVIAHYLLSHSVTANRAVHTRYALFFRMKHVNHEAHKWETLTNAWHEWQIGKG